MHRRLGHRSVKSLEPADKEKVYDDVIITRNHDPFCETCHVSTIGSTRRGGPKEEVTKPRYARLGWPFLYRSLKYSTKVMDVLPAKGCHTVRRGAVVQPCPIGLWHPNKKQIKFGKYRVVGCPCVAKVYKRQTMPDNKKRRTNLTSKNIIQRGVRGIFVGFPANQAGWLVYTPQNGRIFTSADVAFDENFDSVGLTYNRVLLAPFK